MDKAIVSEPVRQLLEVIKGLNVDQVEAHLASGLIPILLKSDPAKINLESFRKVCGLSHDLKSAEDWLVALQFAGIKIGTKVRELVISSFPLPASCSEDEGDLVVRTGLELGLRENASSSEVRRAVESFGGKPCSLRSVLRHRLFCPQQKEESKVAVMSPALDFGRYPAMLAVTLSSKGKSLDVDAGVTIDSYPPSTSFMFIVPRK